MGGQGQFQPGGPLAGPPRPGPIVSARLGAIKVDRVFLKGDIPDTFALYENADTQPVIDVNTGAPLPSASKPLSVKCPSFGRGAKITSLGVTRAGQPASKSLPRCCKRGSNAVVMVEILKGERQFVKGDLTITPRVLDRSGKVVTSTLAAKTTSFESTNITKSFLAVEVDLGDLPDALGLFELELTFTATPKGPATFSFTQATSRQHVICTLDTPLQPDKDTPTTASDTVSGTPHRMGKLMSLLPAPTTDVEDVLWRIYAATGDSTPPNFFNKLGVEITHNGDLKRFFDDSSKSIVNTGHPFRLLEQWLMWVPNTGSPPWNRGACAGYVQLLKTMAATVGIPVRRTLCLPATSQLPPAKPGDPLPAKLAPGAIKVETPMVIAKGGLDVIPALQKATLKGPDGKLYQAHPALMEPAESGEFFEACAVTPAGKFLPGGFSTARVQQMGVPDWTKGPSGTKVPGGFDKAKRGFDSALEVVRWWTQTKTSAGFQRFMAWVHIEDGALKFCWDVEGKPYLAKDYLKVRDTGKALPPP